MNVRLLVLIGASIFVVPTVVLWLEYVKSGATIIELPGKITDIDTTSLADCSAFANEKYKIVFEYSYEYLNKTYKETYELCETNKGVKTQLKIHKIGSEIDVFIKPENPKESSVNRGDLMNEPILISASLLTVVSFLLLSFLTCCYKDIVEELEKYLFDRAKSALDNAL